MNDEEITFSEFVDHTDEYAQSEAVDGGDALDGEHIAHDGDKPNDSAHMLVKANMSRPEALFLLPVKERPFFPGQTLPIILDKDIWHDTIQSVIDNKIQYIGIIYVDTDDHFKAVPDDFAQTGTLVRIHDPKIKPDYIQLIAEAFAVSKSANGFMKRRLTGHA